MKGKKPIFFFALFLIYSFSLLHCLFKLQINVFFFAPYLLYATVFLSFLGWHTYIYFFIFFYKKYAARSPQLPKFFLTQFVVL